MARIDMRIAAWFFVSAQLCLAAGCISQYQMGQPIEPDPRAERSDTGAPSPRQRSASDEWTGKWQQIQRRSDSVKWTEHFHVCTLKYRYRNFQELLLCLDLFEARIAADGKQAAGLESVRKVAPVLTGWLRATAYAELGEPQVALKWAETAWSAVPESYRQARVCQDCGLQLVSSQDAKDFEDVCWQVAAPPFSFGSALFGTTTTSPLPGLPVAKAREDLGHQNPAGLDLKPETITMSLAAQRSLLYLHSGDTEKARAALADLREWEEARDWLWGTIPGLGPAAFREQASLLSIGPHFALGDYASVVTLYEEILKGRQRERFLVTTAQIVFFPFTAVGAVTNLPIDALAYAFSPADVRQFSVAVEDVAKALVYAQSLARLGRHDEARRMLDTLLALPEIRGMGNLYWVALYERGLLARRDGQASEAIRLFTQSVDASEAVRSTISFEAGKIGFAGDKQAVYGALVSVLAERGAWPEAFEVAERAKARALVDLLAQRRDLGAPPTAEDKVRELFALAATPAEASGLPSSQEAMRGINTVADARATLGRVAPEAASLVTVAKVAVEDIAARLAKDETLIDFYTSGDDLFAFLLKGTSVKGFKLDAKGLDEEVRSFRMAIERLDRAADERGRKLFDRLLRPLVAEIDTTKLTISPHGVLHYLPFGALSDGERHFLDRFSPRYIPSASALTYIKSDTPVKPGKLLALGNPDLGNPKFDLPNAQVEAVKVASMFPASRALVRTDASKTAVKEFGTGFSILHFATHGKFYADAPLKSGLLLAKGNEPDGLLTVSDLYSLHWDTDLVTLSACETGLGKVASGDDVIGLTRGFLYAGARSIVATLWQIEDVATESLMVSFYRNLERHDKREALRLAQLEARTKYPQPLYWAPFQLVGRVD